MMGVQQRQNQTGRRMESGLYHQQRIVRTTSNVLRANQLAGHLPDYDERNIFRRTTGRMAYNLYG